MHPADIKCALEKAGWTLRQLGIHHNLSPSALPRTLAVRWPRVQQIIADTLGLNPWDIWPSRYDNNGNPILLRRGRKRLEKNDSTDSRAKRQGEAR
ncbi:helix-turn-helix domain-containing protein [Pseudidiomarina aestuarii]|uniref:helix-turn-helix domain-containing protein n=1 Tax=Pseudidiomarina aestuarii TaxID=624146 RepID=UPI003A96CF77